MRAPGFSLAFLEAFMFAALLVSKSGRQVDVPGRIGVDSCPRLSVRLLPAPLEVRSLCRHRGQTQKDLVLDIKKK